MSLAGIATHYVPFDKLETVTNELLAKNSNIDNVLKPYLPENAKKEFSLAPHMEMINECFSAATVEGIINRYCGKNYKFICLSFSYKMLF